MSGVVKTLAKVAGIGVATYVAAVAVVPCMWVGYQSYRMSKWAFKHPNLSATVVLGLGTLWYAGAQTGCSTRNMQQAAVDIGEYVQHARAEAAERHKVAEGQRQFVQAQREQVQREQAQQEQMQRVHAQEVVAVSTKALSTISNASSHQVPEVQLQNYMVAPPAQQRPHTAPAMSADHLEEIISRPAETLVRPLRSRTHNYYFVKRNETARDIAEKTCGAPGAWRTIAADNYESLAHGIIQGARLAIRKSCTSKQDEGIELFQQLPALSAAYLSAGDSIDERFGDRTRQIIALNEMLGVQYTNRSNNSRVVWYDTKTPLQQR